MKTIITLPSRLRESVSERLNIYQAKHGELLLVNNDDHSPFPPLNAGDRLLFLQTDSTQLLLDTSIKAKQIGLACADAFLFESPYASRYGYMTCVGGDASDLTLFSPLLDLLAPCDAAWWHVGSLGASAFLFTLFKELGSVLQHPIDASNPLPQLAHLVLLQQDAGKIAEAYLKISESQQFTPFMPERHRALAQFLKADESPARQIAQMISLFAKTNAKPTST